MNGAIVRNVIFPAYHWIRGSGLSQILHRYDRLQWKNVVELEEMQFAKLRMLLKHAHDTVPFYRKRIEACGLKDADFGDPEALRLMPLLTKSDINHNRGELISRSAKRTKLFKDSTSGSTGENLGFFLDRDSYVIRKAVEIMTLSWVGIRVGDRTAKLWGAPMDLRKASALRGRIHALLNNNLFLSSYDLSKEALE
jgi:phenylacetate-CoA ligase